LTAADLRAGLAVSADFTGQGWPEPGLTACTPRQAGHRLAELAGRYRFSFFEHWLTDYIGHRGTLPEARQVLETFDAVLGGLLEAWDDTRGLILITSDHGNLETLDHRHHTLGQVPTLVIGHDRRVFAEGLHDLTHIAPRIEAYLSDFQLTTANLQPQSSA
jgi:bisphosphoglycerate-independent phosphoglycerate mutase (AlkP superfamily)